MVQVVEKSMDAHKANNDIRHAYLQQLQDVQEHYTTDLQQAQEKYDDETKQNDELQQLLLQSEALTQATWYAEARLAFCQLIN
jgi:hypothetical protein